ncbi:hypothetical protein JXA31_02365 [Candidatus Bathyarchaeota archaeon]|nr:hypothetical protein [Candidatus Bathyarchaeota archaeon]
MKKKVVVLATEDDLSVDLTLHDFSAALLAEFAEKVVRPYYSSNMSDAVKDLMQKAIREETFVLSHVKLVKSGSNSIKNIKKGIG